MSFSAIGLVLSSFPVFVHGTECLFPLHARFTANVLPLFSFNLFSKAGSTDTWLGLDDAMMVLNKGIDALPLEKQRAAADLAFVYTFEQRQGSAGFVSTAAASIYAATLPLAERHPLHFAFMVMAVIMTIGNLHHATGMPALLGYNPMISPAGKGLGYAFVPFWIAAFFFNYMGFVESKEA